MSRLRLDEALVERGFYTSRARARDAILRGTVLVDGIPARKPSQGIYEAAVLAVSDSAKEYVSRAAVKLIHALDHFEIPVSGRQCLDLGASAGGFCQVLLERKASHIIAIDVGHDQMMLDENDRLELREGVNARDLTAEDLPPDLGLITCDVSFIPLHIALAPALEIAPSGAHVIALIKPQFEVGKLNIGKGGLVKDVALHQSACDDVSAFVTNSGWKVLGVIPSPIDGGDGSEEFLLAAVKE